MKGVFEMATKKATSTASSKKTNNTACCSKASNPYMGNGITISPLNFNAGDKIKVTYNGLLSESGANEVYAHVGWGDTWENVNDVKMSRTKTGFTTTITAYNSTLNLCFKDNSNNWDNNYGYNYSIYCK